MALSIAYSISNAEIRTESIEYRSGDRTLKGHLAYDDATDAKRPAVIVVHEWWGNNDYSRWRAEQIAGLGYVGFAIDMYGDGRTTTDPKQAAQWSAEIRNDPQLALARFQAAMHALKAQPMVDGDRIAAIGYCFGGSVVLNMARANLPLVGVVSFHGSLAGGDAVPANIKPKILVCNGADDSFVSTQEIAAFMDEMRKANADWQFINYGGAVHSFTNPNADKAGIRGVSYNKNADQRSWGAMKAFLIEVFGTS